MEITIDDTIEVMEYLKTQNSQLKSIDVAISTMQKYQKIVQIIKDHDVDRMPEDYWYIDKIREVIENGNVD